MNWTSANSTRADRMPVEQRRSLTGVAWGLAGIAATTAAFFPVAGHVPHSVPALFLLIPIAVVAARTTSAAAVVVAVAAASTYAIAFIPPIGSIRPGLTEDAFVLAAFVVVALVVGLLRRRRSGTDDVLDDRRATLIRTVSHDLRTPLSTIKAVSTDLLDGQRHDERTTERLLGLVVRESDRMDRIVGNLLSLSRVQAGALAPDLSPHAVEPLVLGAVARFEDLAGVTISTWLQPHLPQVRADVTQVDQVLANLIENALRHATSPGGVAVDACRDGEAVRIRVTDDGPGFSPAARAALFEPFGWSDESSGLGLSVARAIVEAHGGTIAVADGPAGGARVSFTLPVAA